MIKGNYKIILIGPQGSGKGTQAQLLAEKLGLPVFSSGNILRQRMQSNDKFGLDLANMINNAVLIPDEIINKIMIDKIKTAGDRGYVLDGYPRSLAQAEFLNNYERITHVIEINISDKESKRRLTGRRTCELCQTVYHLDYHPPKKIGICDNCGGKLIIRNDDKEEIIEKRLAIYHENVELIINFYRKYNVYYQINGEQDIPSVAAEVFRKLGLAH